MPPCIPAPIHDNASMASGVGVLPQSREQHSPFQNYFQVDDGISQAEELIAVPISSSRQTTAPAPAQLQLHLQLQLQLQLQDEIRSDGRRKSSTLSHSSVAHSAHKPHRRWHLPDPELPLNHETTTLISLSPISSLLASSRDILCLLGRGAWTLSHSLSVPFLQISPAHASPSSTVLGS